MTKFRKPNLQDLKSLKIIQSDKLYPVSKSDAEIDRLIMNLHQRKEDFTEGDLLERTEAHENYVLVWLPLNLVDHQEWDYDEDKVKKYSGFMTAIPPIVFDWDAGSIIDGTHRAYVAVERGATHIAAYIGTRHADELLSGFEVKPNAKPSPFKMKG